MKEGLIKLTEDAFVSANPRNAK